MIETLLAILIVVAYIVLPFTFWQAVNLISIPQLRFFLINAFAIFYLLAVVKVIVGAKNEKH